VDSVTPDVKDEELLRKETEAARRLGFGGKLLIHPSQVGPSTAAFRPSDAERDWARRVLDLVAQGAAGAAAIDGKMIDKPVEEAARRILARAGEYNA
jgi:citrate lyase subunit beta/citryl-CoA lyase